MKTPKKKLSSFQIILLGFAGVVLLGCIFIVFADFFKKS